MLSRHSFGLEAPARGVITLCVSRFLTLNSRLLLVLVSLEAGIRRFELIFLRGKVLPSACGAVRGVHKLACGFYIRTSTFLACEVRNL